MTNDELFERWWNEIGAKSEAIGMTKRKALAKSAFHAALSDEGRETCVESMVEAEWGMKRDAEVDRGFGKEARAVDREIAADRYAETRRRLEGQE